LAGQKLDEMRSAVATDPADYAKIARVAREFCSLAAACEPRAGLSDYRVVAPGLGYQADVEVTL
jgi:hypothetical protein